MTRDAFRRLALFVAASIYWLGVVLIAHYLGVWAALFVVVAALIFGSLLTVELTPSMPETQGGPVVRRFGKPGRDDEDDDEDLTERSA